MGEKESSVTIRDGDGTILKPFLIEGGWFIVETNISDSGDIMFSIRGTVIPQGIQNVLQKTDEYLKTIINDNKPSCS